MPTTLRKGMLWGAMLGMALWTHCEKSPDVYPSDASPGQSDGGTDLGASQCSDLRKNPMHCGACNHACTAAQTCVEGACVQPACAWKPLGSPTVIYLPTGTPSLAVVADWNEDGRQDVVVGASSGPLYTYLQTGGMLKEAAVHPPGSAYGATDAWARDFDKDNHWDFIAGTATTPFWKGSGSATFVRSTTPQLATPLWDSAVADVNGDGVLDVVAQVQDRIQVLVSQSGGYAVQSPTGITGLSQGSAIALGDLTSDGKMDLVITTGGGPSWATTLRPGLGDGTFGAVASSFSNNYGSSFAHRLVVCDVDGSGPQEVIAANAAGVGFVLRPGGSGATLSQVQALSLGSNVNRLRCVDLDASGKPDLVTSHYAVGGVSVQVSWNGGSGMLGTPKQLLGSIAVGTIDVGDLDDNGALDIAVAGNNNLQIIRGTCN